MKILELDLETINHSPYLPNLLSTDYYLFRNIDNFIQGKIANFQQAVENAFRSFIGSRSLGFYVKGINELPLKWQKYMDASGAYFE